LLHLTRSFMASLLAGCALTASGLTLSSTAAQSPTPTPEGVISSCTGEITPTLSSSEVRICDPITVTVRAEPRCTACDGDVNVVFVYPYSAPESGWLVQEASDAIAELTRFQTGLPVQAAVVEYWSAALGNGESARTTAPLSPDLSRSLSAMSHPVMTALYWAYEQGAQVALRQLSQARPRTPGGRLCEFIVFFLASCNNPADSTCVASQAQALKAAQMIHKDNVTLMVGCPGRSHPTWNECRGAEEKMPRSSRLYTEFPERGRIAAMLSSELGNVAGQGQLREASVTQVLPDGLRFVPGSASETPADVAVEPGGTTLRWKWTRADATDAHTVTYRVEPNAEGQMPVHGELGLLDSRGRGRLVPMQPVTISVAGLCITPSPTPPPTATGTPSPTPTTTSRPTGTGTPTSTPTASPTASPTPRPSPVFLPLALSEQCIPGSQRIDVVLVIDASTSMLLGSSIPGRTRLDAATDAARSFLDLLTLPADQAALVAFNSTAVLLQELTGNRLLLDAAFTRITVSPQTRIHLGVELAHQELRSPRRRPGNLPVMILLTDGRANPESPELAVRQAQAAKDDGVTIFTIGLGADDDLDTDALQRMASRPSTYYHAPGAEQLISVYGQIAVALPCPPERFWGKR
jgi:Mg-chelatase subunit ChlD